MVEFDAEAGEAALADALTRVEAGADESWVRKARVTIVQIASERAAFTTDEMWKRIEKPREPRAMGALVRWAMKKAKVIEDSGVKVKTLEVQAHRRPKTLYRSLIFHD